MHRLDDGGDAGAQSRFDDEARLGAAAVSLTSVIRLSAL